MKLYVASSWRNQRYPIILNGLRAYGHQCYDWRTSNAAFSWDELDPKWETWPPLIFVDALSRRPAVEGFRSDFNAMRDADACVLVLPCGRSAHLEAGWFVGANKPLIILLEEHVPPVPELMYKMATSIETTLLGVAKTLQDIGWHPRFADSPAPRRI